jgi:endonuclease-3 related protein
MGHYGPQGWWPGDGALEICVGAILTQNTNWSNVNLAMTQLKAVGALSVDRLHNLPEANLAELIRSSGYFNVKARKLKAFAGHLVGLYNGDITALLKKPSLQDLRQELLSIYGIGEETADDMLLYAAGRPIFVVDSYTQRIVDRLGLERPNVFGRPEKKPYGAYQDFFMEHLPLNTSLFNEFHALLVRLGKDVCKKRNPLCNACPLQMVCGTGQVVR